MMHWILNRTFQQNPLQNGNIIFGEVGTNMKYLGNIANENILEYIASFSKVHIVVMHFCRRDCVVTLYSERSY